MADFIHKTLENAGPNAVVLFGKSYCASCACAKSDLQNIGIIPVVVDLDLRPDGDAIYKALQEWTSQTILPSAWVCGRHIGGPDDLRDQINLGMFDFLPKLMAEKYAAKAGIKPCGCQQDAGAPCLSVPTK